MPGVICRRLLPSARKFCTSAVRNSGDHHFTPGVAGSTLPFSVKNKVGLVIGFTIYCTVGFSTPFILWRRALLRE